MARRERLTEHLLRRAGFGASPEEVETYAEIGYSAAVERLLNYEQVPDTVDDYIGKPGYVGVTARGQFMPRTNITDARQRWLFRMVHTERPLQEKMALYWHHHFATAYSKLAGAVGSEEGTRMLAAKPGEDPGQVKGQLELIREHALGNFRDFQVAMAKDIAMLYWLDGRSNVRTRPQENYARELMELFTFGVGFYTEADVYAGARVFTGWNLRRASGPAGTSDPASRYEFLYNAGQHDTSAKAFSFPIYADGSKTIPARSSADGLQDGIDLINACVRHPETGRRLARRLYAFFISELGPAPDGFVGRIADVFSSSGYDMRAVMRAILYSPEFIGDGVRFARYSWPVEFVVRAIKETGWAGYSVNDALTPLSNMGQQLFEPPDVNGWDTGPGWFSSGGTLARMNFAAQLATNQKFTLREEAKPFGRSPESTLSWTLERLSVMEFDGGPYNELLNYLRAGTNWTGSDAELLVKVPGLVHLVLGSSEYQFV
jgi:uncharacterized protein (DUF1800 family)